MKYTREQLRVMATRTLLARDEGDPRFVQLVLQMMLRTGESAQLIEQRIVALAAP